MVVPWNGRIVLPVNKLTEHSTLVADLGAFANEPSDDDSPANSSSVTHYAMVDQTAIVTDVDVLLDRATAID